MPSALDKTLHDLSWTDVARAVAARCAGPRADLEELPLATTVDGARLALEETREASRLLDAGEPLPVGGIREVRAHVERVSRDGVLDGVALRDIASTLAAARVLRRFLGARRERAPRLHSACPFDPTLDRLEQELSGCVEPDGRVADHASADLRRLRAEVSALRGRLVARLEQLVHDKADILSDRFYTLREGRYVLPLRRDAHEKIPGIVHGTSSSGATVFVEPRQLVAQGNRLKMAHAEMEREEARVLAVLSAEVRAASASVRAAADALDHADLRAASARFGQDLRCTFPEVVPEPRIGLRRARHPLLALEGVDVVPNDIELRGGRALILSGPNAGGKTVALKVLGLAALMVRAGLPVPADEGSVCGFFSEVLSDVGDDQSIAANLSTFSAHVVNIGRILSEAGERSLVLLDELAGSTDPHEGAALACAIVGALCARGAAVAVTTHYEALKAMAIGDDRLDNASVGFDVEAMEPTFRLLAGVPGASSALLVAARFGIPADIVDAARALLPAQARTFDDLVRGLEERRRALEAEHEAAVEARARAERDRAAARSERAAAEAARAEIDRRGRKAVDEAAQKALVEIRATSESIAEARRALRQSALEEEAVERARELVEKARTVARRVRERAAQPEAPAEERAAIGDDLSPGDRVWVRHLRMEADVLDAPARGKVRVAAGAMKLWVDRDGLRMANRPERAASPSYDEAPARPPLAPNPDNTLDVRGMRVDDAIGMMESFVDRLYSADHQVVYIRHGYGSGALRKALREHLARDRHWVDRVRPGTHEEGGEAVTVVYLR